MRTLTLEEDPLLKADGRKPGKSMAQGLARYILAGLSLAVVAGCAVRPQVMTHEEQKTMIESSRSGIFSQQAVVSGPITLEDAIARALKYNLDHRVAIMEEALRSKQLDVANFDMLPRMAANAGWTTRSNENYTTSEDSVTGIVYNNPSLSQDQSRGDANLMLSWNVLDFGVSYYQAKQNADQVLIAEQRRRKMVNQIVQQVRNAYWKAASGEPLYKSVVPLLADARKALADSQAIEANRLSPPLDALQYQKGLLQIVKDLELLERDLAISRTELAVLMGLPPGTDFKVVSPPAEKMTPPKVSMTLVEMENIALYNRPELKEEFYQKRISSAETRKAFLKMLPGLSFNTSLNYDSNSYLVNNDWAEAGARVTYNLLGLLSAPAAIDAAEAQEKVNEQKRLALCMAISAQVNIGYQQYLRSRQAYDQTKMLDGIEQRIFRHIQNAASSDSKSRLEGIRARVSAIYAEVNSYRAFADMQAAISNLYVSMGLDPVPETMENHELETLKKAISKIQDDWHEGRIGLPTEEDKEKEAK